MGQSYSESGKAREEGQRALAAEINSIYGITPLHNAAARDDIEVVSKLLATSKGKAAVNQVTRTGKTPLFIAAQQGHVEVVKVLLQTAEGRATVNQKDKFGGTPLCIAVEEGHVKVVEALLAIDEGRAMVEQAMEDGSTPLVVSAQMGHIDIGVLLLAAGANFSEAEKWAAGDEEILGKLVVISTRYQESLAQSPSGGLKPDVKQRPPQSAKRIAQLESASPSASPITGKGSSSMFYHPVTPLPQAVLIVSPSQQPPVLGVTPSPSAGDS